MYPVSCMHHGHSHWWWLLVFQEQHFLHFHRSIRNHSFTQQSQGSSVARTATCVLSGHHVAVNNYGYVGCRDMCSWWFQIDWYWIGSRQRALHSWPCTSIESMLLQRRWKEKGTSISEKSNTLVKGDGNHCGIGSTWGKGTRCGKGDSYKSQRSLRIFVSLWSLYKTNTRIFASSCLWTAR